MTLGGSAPRLPRESQVCVLRPGGGLDPELPGLPQNSGGSPQEERPCGEAHRQDLRGAELGKRKPPSLSLSPESRSAGQSRCALPPAPRGGGAAPYPVTASPSGSSRPGLAPRLAHSLSPGVSGRGALGLLPTPPTQCRSPSRCSCSLGVPRMPVGQCCPQLGSGQTRTDGSHCQEGEARALTRGRRGVAAGAALERSLLGTARAGGRVSRAPGFLWTGGPPCNALPAPRHTGTRSVN